MKTTVSCQTKICMRPSCSPNQDFASTGCSVKFCFPDLLQSKIRCCVKKTCPPTWKLIASACQFSDDQPSQPSAGEVKVRKYSRGKTLNILYLFFHSMESNISVETFRTTAILVGCKIYHYFIFMLNKIK